MAVLHRARVGPWRSGDHLVQCDRCGSIIYASDARKDWDGKLVCEDDWDGRHPQLDIKIPVETGGVKDARPERNLLMTKGATADSDGVCQSQQPSAAGNLTMNGTLVSGGVATFDYARPVTVTSDADDFARMFRISGTAANGIVITEDIHGSSENTVRSYLYFKTVTNVWIDAATVGNISVGMANIPGDPADDF